MRNITKIYIHESVSKYGNALLVNWWHKLNGWGTRLINRFRDNNDESFWANGGYHFIIQNGKPYSNDIFYPFMDGDVEMIRPLHKQGAGVRGDNKESIHVCIIKDGEGSITKKQWTELVNVCVWLVKRYKLTIDDVIGHNEYWIKKNLKPLKTCPNINMKDLRLQVNTYLKLNQ